MTSIEQRDIHTDHRTTAAVEILAVKQVFMPGVVLWVVMVTVVVTELFM